MADAGDERPRGRRFALRAEPQGHFGLHLSRDKAVGEGLFAGGTDNTVLAGFSKRRPSYNAF